MFSWVSWLVQVVRPVHCFACAPGVRRVVSAPAIVSDSPDSCASTRRAAGVLLLASSVNRNDSDPTCAYLPKIHADTTLIWSYKSFWKRYIQICTHICTRSAECISDIHHAMTYTRCYIGLYAHVCVGITSSYEPYHVHVYGGTSTVLSWSG